jgi:gluconokinase
MGPAGAGKTTIGELLAAQLHWDFADADNFHPPANIAKMSHGIPLQDEDRIPWLHSLRDAILKWDAQGKNVMLACSALKRSYRELLVINSNVKLVYLKGSFELFRERLRARKGHYAGEQILAGQFADLEEPEDALIIDSAQPPEQIVSEIRKQLLLT